MKPWQKRTKRAMDVTLAAAGLVVLSPVFLAVAAAVRLKMGRPVFFRQARPGLHGRPFVMLKFRTMRPPRDDEAAALTDAQRLTLLGRILRKTSLDELPELWNVLRGDMSLVGPRPLVMEYLAHYTPRQSRRHEVRPGITGWAQVNGRQAVTFSKRLEMDVWYVDHCSLGLDLRILAKTLMQVVHSEGVILEQTLEDVDDLGLSRDIQAAARMRAARISAGP